MQSYGIIGMALWIIYSPYGETTVSLRRNCSFPPWELSFPTVETIVSNAGNDNPLEYNLSYRHNISFNDAILFSKHHV